MGFKDLTGFRSDLDFALGNRGFDSDRLDSWINAGLQELTSAVYFPELETSTTITTSSGTDKYTLSENILAVLSVRDTTNDHVLRKMGHSFLARYDDDDTGMPEYWMHRGSSIVLKPTPDSSYSIFLTVYIYHPKLDTTSSKTLLSPEWDRAVHMLAMSHALSDVDEHDRATMWLERARLYIGSRIQRRALEVGGVPEPLAPVFDYDSLDLSQ